MAAGGETMRAMGPLDAREPFPVAELVAYLVLWAGFNAAALASWPDVVDMQVVTPWTFAPLLIAYHLSKASIRAWWWGLAFHVSVSLGASGLAIGHTVLNEEDAALVAYAAGSWVLVAYLLRRPQPFPFAKAGAIVVGLIVLSSGWGGFQSARAAQEELPRGSLLAPAPWTSSESPPGPPDLSSFATGEPALVAFGERNDVPWAIYTYRTRHSEDCIAFVERRKLFAGSCPLDLLDEHLVSQSYSGGKSGNVVYGAVSPRVRGLELWFDEDRFQRVPIVVPPDGAGLDVNVYVAFLPDDVGPDGHELSAFGASGERIDRIGSLPRE